MPFSAAAPFDPHCPEWPDDLTSTAQVLGYLNGCSPPALALVSTGLHVAPASSRGDIPDTLEGAAGSPFQCTLFGQVARPVQLRGRYRTFCVRRGASLPADATDMFNRQWRALEGLIQTDPDITLRSTEDPIEVYVGQLSPGSCTFHVPDDEGRLEATVPRSTPDFPLQEGDWVVFTATLHRRPSHAKTKYEMQARHVRLLLLSSDGDDDDDDDGFITDDERSHHSQESTDEEGIAVSSVASSTDRESGEPSSSDSAEESQSDERPSPPFAVAELYSDEAEESSGECSGASNSRATSPLRSTIRKFQEDSDDADCPRKRRRICRRN
ncbi:hypothetical protein C8R43DRAFT_956879 [Mycena crocata]|nr:hypothetical protein C8R43DRAFT_956879 [Mycena crocata]